MSPGPARAALTEFVLKVHSRCDLACDHCYVYEHADQSWRRRPTWMTPEVLRAAADRIAEHATAHRLSSVSVVLHGGEPLLLGPERMRRTVADLRRVIDPVTRLRIGMQTNGVLLSERFCDLLAEYDVAVGVSLDGARAANDLHRRFRNGASSYDQVLRALALLRRPAYRRLWSGLLCTVDVRNDPVGVYESLLAQEPPRIDFLLPHATWDAPPWRPGTGGTAYADWLRAVYDRWRADGRPVPVRLFDSLLSTARGGPSGTEWLGLDPIDLAVVETDGEWEQADSLKTAYDGAPATGMTVFSHPVDDVAASPELARRRSGRAGLSGECRRCAVVDQCGGGLFAHRYGAGHFDHPSVYCADLKELVVHVNENLPAPVPVRLDADLSDGLVDRVAASTGDGDGDAIRQLVEAQTAIVRALLREVAGGLPDGGLGADGWAALTELDRRAPGSVARVAAHPYVRTWAVDCLAGTGTGARHGPGYLGAIAAAVASDAGVPVRVTVPVRAGRLHLPTVGTVLLPEVGDGTAQVDVGPGSLKVSAGDVTVAVRTDAGEDTPRWQPTRTLVADDMTVLLEDGDPHRDCHRLPVGERLDDAGATRWAATFAAAWGIVTDEVPGHAEELRAGLRALVPLRRSGDGVSEASTGRQAFGGVAATETDAGSLAVLLVHEFQHSKMNALLDICDLVDRTRTTDIVVGWRPDPRPVEAVLHGIYAHAAVADIWRIRADRQLDGAQAVYRRYRDWTAEAIGALETADALTPAGSRLLRLVARSMAGWPS
ncbi:FxsB family cyclophane-forming radical SAM/SPASM peptide maturase [Micromonospora sp. CPCC 205546]|uniref:FxsB family cyclophane-forming radical SAM/SPASM peptide maturase n=1 Tax=Micromonospora sp. CPCC 205546 TaxID=3122397 RepID=UPI002FEFC6CA